MEEREEVFETEETVEEPVEEEVEEETAETEDDWGDDSDGEEDGSDWLLDESEDTEEPETEDEEQGENDTESADDGKSEEGNQLFKINYLGKEEELTLEQMTELAQKGRDYDHVRKDRDELKSKTGKQLAFLQKLADRAGVTVDEQIDLTEAMWLMDEEAEKGNTLTESQALLKVQQRHKEEADNSKSEKIEDKTDFNPQIDRFLAVYPDVKAADIPQEVWDQAMRLDGDLLTAYLHYENKMLKEENARKQQEIRNTKNKNRSTGPLKSAGANRQKDDFLDGWDS